MTYLELQDTVLRELEEAVSNPVFHTRDNVKVALNDAYRRLAEETEFYEKDLSISLVANQLHYNLGVLDPSVVAVRRVKNDQNGRYLYVRTVDQMDAAYRKWTSIAGTPEILVPRSVLVFAIWPFSALGTGTLTAKVAAIPPELSADADTPPFPEIFHRVIMEGAKSDLFATEKEAAKAKRSMSKFRGGSGALRAWVGSRASKALTGVIGGGS